MKPTIAAVFVLLTIFGASNAQFTTQCLDTQYLLDVAKTCMDDNGVSIPDVDLSTVDIDTLGAIIEGLKKTTCAKPMNMKNAVKCMAGTFYSCLDNDPEFGEVKKYLPSSDRLGNIVDIVCKINVSNYHVDCFNTKSVAIQPCTTTVTSKIQGRLENGHSLDKVICESLDDLAKCMLKEMRGCGCATVEPLIDMMRGPFYPEVCGAPGYNEVNCDPKNPQAFAENSAAIRTGSWLLSVVTAALVLLPTRLL